MRSPLGNGAGETGDLPVHPHQRLLQLPKPRAGCDNLRVEADIDGHDEPVKGTRGEENLQEDHLQGEADTVPDERASLRMDPGWLVPDSSGWHLSKGKTWMRSHWPNC